MSLPRTVGALLLAVCIPFSALAASADRPGITLNPVRLNLAPGQRAVSITVTNNSGEEKVFQVNPMTWAHENGEDRYGAAEGIVANPPLFRVAPGASQIVRIGLLKPQKQAPATETTYRVYFEEVSAAGGPAANPAVPLQLRLLLRLGVPLFMQPGTISPPNLQWTLSKAASGKLKLSLSNHGNAHVRAWDIALSDAAKPEQNAKIDGFAYVFAGETRSWNLDWPAKSSKLNLTAQTEEGAVHVELPLQMD